RTVPVGHPDELALVALDRLVDHRSHGLLHDKLLLTQQLPDASSMSELLREGGYWSLSGVAREGQSLEDVEALLRGVIDDLKAGNFTPEDLAAVVLHAQIDHKLALESRASRVAHMTSAYATGQQWRDYLSRIERLAAVTPAQIQAVARRYFGDDHVLVRRRDGVHKPLVLPKPHITPVAIDPARESAYAKAIRARPHRPPTPRWVAIGKQVDAGRNPAGPIYATQNTHSDLFQLVYNFNTGLRDQPLLCHALDLLELSGAGSHTAISLQKQLYQLGTAVKTECGAQEMRITVTGIDTHLQRSVELLRLWLQAPNFDDKTLEALLANTLSQRRDEQASPESIARALAAFAQYKDANYYRLQPSDAVLRRTRGETLQTILTGIARLPHTTMYFGSHEPQSLTPLVDLGKTVPHAGSSYLRHYREIDRPTLFFVDKPMAQAMIEVLLPSGPLDTTEEPLAIALQYLMGNDSGGVVFQELRESRGLAYSAYASFELPRRPGDEASLYAHVGTQAEKTVSALGLLLELLRNPPIDPPRFANTQKSLTEEYLTSAIVPRDMPYWMHRWRTRGHSGDPRAQELAAISALELADLQAFGKKVADAHPIISLLGDRKRIDFEALRTTIPGLKIVELQAADLFGYASSK
ncbi:MAG: insulinase family protein, partial [Nannocystaceae bacterium]